MLFNSYLFLIGFLPATLAGFAIACRIGRRAALIWLIAASLAFYAAWGWTFLPLLVASVIGNFTVAALIGRVTERPGLQMALLTAGIVADLGVLTWCKFAAPVLPPGISFFTFTQIGFLLDRRGADDAGPPLLNYALFVGFFPQVISGPILTGRDILPQLAAIDARRPAALNLAAGGVIFMIGLLKKTVLADPLAATVAQGFGAPEAATLLVSWQAALAWSLQLYFDFSGYSDMAIGLGRLFNLRFPMNFASPYKAQSVIDYWQRWHMTLTRFLMLRVYSPLTVMVLRQFRALGQRTDRRAQQSIGGFATMLAAPLLLTMGLAGVWHGTGWTYLLFGLLHGLFLAVNHAWRIFHPGRRSQTIRAVIGRVVLTYLCVLIGSVVFRAPSVGSALSLLGGMAGLHGVPGFSADPWAVAHAALEWLWLASLFAIVWLAPNTQQIVGDAPWRQPVWRPTLPWAVAFGCAATLGLLSLGGTGEFLYFQF